MGKRKRKGVSLKNESNPEDLTKVPKSFIFKSGPVGLSVAHLITDLRRVMAPNTAKRLKEKKRNKLKDFLQVAGQFGVSHFLMFTQTEVGTYMRTSRIPRGPTLTFRVLNYVLRRDVKASIRNSKNSKLDYEFAPTLILNNFGEDKQSVKLIASMFQNMFPAIDVLNTNTLELRRVVMLNYNSETETIDFRHYRVDIRETGVSKSIKAIFKSNIPALGNLKDISEITVREALGADSDVEEGVDNVVDVGSGIIGRKNTGTRSVKLTEIGPRMELQLVKVQAGMCNGEVLYHRFIQKTEEELQQQKKEFSIRKGEIERRKKEQEKNVQKKKEAAEAHRIACGAPARENTENSQGETDDEGKAQDDQGNNGIESFDINENDLFDDSDSEQKNDSVHGSDDSADEDLPSPKKPIFTSQNRKQKLKKF